MPYKQRQKRPYHAGAGGFVKSASDLMTRIADKSIPDEALTGYERAARALTEEITSDLGGEPSAAATLLVRATVRSALILEAIDAYVLALAQTDGLVNRRSRKAYPIVIDRTRIASEHTRELQALGLEKRKKPPRDLLDSYLAEKYAPTAEDGESAAPEPAPRPRREPVR